MRDELLNREVFMNLVEAQVLTKVIPRASLGLMSGLTMVAMSTKSRYFLRSSYICPAGKRAIWDVV